MTIAQTMTAEFEREAGSTRRLLERVPADKLGWRPHPKSRTLGQLAMHVATVPGAIASLAHLDTWAFEKGGKDVDPKNVKEILDAHDAGVATVKESLERMDDTKIMGAWVGTVGGKPVITVPRVGFLRTIMLNHHYHHRGQLTVYLRELNVPLPSIYGPTADENPFQAAMEAAKA